LAVSNLAEAEELLASQSSEIAELEDVISGLEKEIVELKAAGKSISPIYSSSDLTNDIKALTEERDHLSQGYFDSCCELETLKLSLLESEISNHTLKTKLNEAQDNLFEMPSLRENLLKTQVNLQIAVKELSELRNEQFLTKGSQVTDNHYPERLSSAKQSNNSWLTPELDQTVRSGNASLKKHANATSANSTSIFNRITVDPSSTALIPPCTSKASSPSRSVQISGYTAAVPSPDSKLLIEQVHEIRLAQSHETSFIAACDYVSYILINTPFFNFLILSYDIYSRRTSLNITWRQYVSNVTFAVFMLEREWQILY